MLVCDSDQSSARLALRLLVLVVLPAVAAVLLDVQSVRVILLVFHCGVVASFALATGQRDDDSVVFFSQDPNSYLLLLVALTTCRNLRS